MCDDSGQLALFDGLPQTVHPGSSPSIVTEDVPRDEQLFAWQGRALADGELDAFPKLLACAIAAGVKRSDGWLSRLELGRLIRAPTNRLGHALEQLVARGYLDARATSTNEAPRRVYRPRLSGESRAIAPPHTKVTSFPLARRGALERKHAAKMIEMSAAQADKHLRHIINWQSANLRRRGVPENEIARQVRDLETAIKVRGHVVRVRRRQTEG
jgi:uncharacterized protein DUF6074